MSWKARIKGCKDFPKTVSEINYINSSYGNDNGNIIDLDNLSTANMDQLQFLAQVLILTVKGRNKDQLVAAINDVLAKCPEMEKKIDKRNLENLRKMAARLFPQCFERGDYYYDKRLDYYDEYGERCKYCNTEVSDLFEHQMQCSDKVIYYMRDSRQYLLNRLIRKLAKLSRNHPKDNIIRRPIGYTIELIETLVNYPTVELRESLGEDPYNLYGTVRARLDLINEISRPDIKEALLEVIPEEILVDTYRI